MKILWYSSHWEVVSNPSPPESELEFVTFLTNKTLQKSSSGTCETESKEVLQLHPSLWEFWASKWETLSSGVLSFQVRSYPETTVLEKAICETSHWLPHLSPDFNLSLSRCQMCERSQLGPSQPVHTPDKYNQVTLVGAMWSRNICQLTPNRVLDPRNLEI